MKRIIPVLTCALLAFALLSCSAQEQDRQNKQADLKVQMYMRSILKTWEMKTVADVPGYTFAPDPSLTPSCSNCPPKVDPATGAVTTYNPDFAFFVKKGDPTKLLVFFMGGGACWDITNCVYNHTYSESLFESVELLGLVSSGLGAQQGIGGFLDTHNQDNPFKDWTIVYVPYCTGDLNAGQEDHVYTDTYNTADPIANVTIRHRGAVNRDLVLKWMEANIPPAGVAQLFVTGLSAGSYASLLAFPYLRDIYTGGTAYYLGDAGVGYAGIDSGGNHFTDIAKDRWNVQLPAAVFGTTDISTFDEYKDVVHEGVDYYRTNKPGDRFAQYTTKYDKTQTWFYNIQVGDHIEYPDFWGSESGANPDLWVYKAWSDGMLDAIDIGLSNYAYYIGAGTDHTIIFSDKVYTETSGSTSFLGWVDSLINDVGIPASTACTVCNAPF